MFGARASLSAVREGDAFIVQLRLPLDAGASGRPA
jgi:hypothetical protein